MERVLPFRHGPSQAPDWRFAWARDSVEHPAQAFRRCPDRDVRIAKQFWSAWSRCQNEDDRRRLFVHMPTMAHAFTIFQDAQSTVRHALEARVLADEAPATVAGKNALPETVVRCYEAVFYDVRTHLGSLDYIFGQILGPRLHACEHGWSYDLVWKFFAFIGGSVVLDEIMHLVAPGARPSSAAAVAAFLAENTQGAIHRQIAIAARALMPTEPRTAKELVRLSVQLERAKPPEDRVSHNVYEQHIAAMLAEIPWLVGMENEDQFGPKVAAFDKGAFEPRDDQLALLADGQDVPALEGLKDMTMPPPPAKQPRK